LSVADFAQPWVERVSVRRQIQFAAHQFHGGAGADQGTGDEIQRRPIASVVCKQIEQDVTGRGGLATAEIVERNVLRALQPACRVPRRLTMANVVDDGRGHRICDYSLTGETSGRSPGIRHGFGDIRLPSSFRPVCWYTSTLLRYSPNRREINAVLRRLRLPE